MEKIEWFGAAGLCSNDNDQILMIKQGSLDEEKRWSIPSGGKEENETYEDCCVREFSEETGYDIHVVKPLFLKETKDQGVDVKVHYFEVEIIGGTERIQDPDHLIYAIEWKSADEIRYINLSFPEDRDLFLTFIKENADDL
ncbi:ADP-ribose pyrophosphatase YjhB (NUDIX family) [Virgibacillus natechei]|uniref:ADP-ribose pyrophosphatase YjhB (NUDIX family) n=1 Tax=Virgibacillus natechei TaxID=1216297 RepID=A0ABS4IHW6_9BACI|nr:NUDIX hydrolase [Virgibacillus natechei]MBP1970540.1 ADP-ribose pyrophosphatase YjhB (NUDIX family) [Virgibacillus natechei]UZD14057.1 NUDIX hydrolase [Virgibacillus natechei]